MKFIFLIGVLLSSLNINAQITQVHYFFTSDNTFEDRELKAVIGIDVFSLITMEDKLCARIVRVSDFNKNGFEDVLIEVINGCGGNCCANSYAIFSYDGQKFLKTEAVGYDWNGIEISESSLEFNFIVETVNEGLGNTSMCSNKVETFRLNGFNFEPIQTISEEKVKAITEIKAEDFLNREEEELFLSYDLDGDGKQDKITCKYWSRWGKIGLWEIHFGSGIVYKGESSPKRIGVLSTKTRGISDLVLECEEIIKWNGKSYN